MTAHLIRAVRQDHQRRRLSLDAAGRHATMPAPDPYVEEDDEGEDTPPAPPSAQDFIDGGLRMVAARTRSREAAAEHVAAIEAECDEEAAVRELLGAFDLTMLVDSLERLTPRQREIITARLDIIAEGDTPSHHAVGRRLGLSAANVSKQWARLTARASGLGQVSTPAA